jgi:hypothetical protein
MSEKHTQPHPRADPHQVPVTFFTNYHQVLYISLSLAISLKRSVVDPHWFQCGSGSSILRQCGSESGSRSRVLMTEKLREKIAAGKKSYFFIKKLQFTYTYASTSLKREHPVATTGHSPQSDHPVLQNIKIS